MSVPKRRRPRSGIYGAVSITNPCFAVPTVSMSVSILFSAPTH